MFYLWSVDEINLRCVLFGSLEIKNNYNHQYELTFCSYDSESKYSSSVLLSINLELCDEGSAYGELDCIL